MNKILQYTTVVLLTALVFFTTTGLSVHRLFCYCKGEAVASLFKPSDPCQDGRSAKAHGCCKGNACSPDSPDGEHGCSDCPYQYVKLDAKYVPSFFDVKLAVPTASEAMLAVYAAPVVVKKSTMPWNQAIPPPTIPTLLSLLQTYRC